MRQSERVRDGAEEGEDQSREGSWSNLVSTSQCSLRTLGEASQIRIKLNRQIPELEHPLSLRKQRATNRSNRQRMQFCKNEISTQELRTLSRTRSVTDESDPCISDRELLGLEILQLAENKHPRPVLIANFEPNHFLVFQTGHSK